MQGGTELRGISYPMCRHCQCPLRAQPAAQGDSQPEVDRCQTELDAPPDKTDDDEPAIARGCQHDGPDGEDAEQCTGDVILYQAKDECQGQQIQPDAEDDHRQHQFASAEEHQEDTEDSAAHQLDDRGAIDRTILALELVSRHPQREAADRPEQTETGHQEGRADGGKSSEEEQGLHSLQSKEAIAYPKRAEDDIEEGAERHIPCNECGVSNL